MGKKNSRGQIEDYYYSIFNQIVQISGNPLLSYQALLFGSNEEKRRILADNSDNAENANITVQQIVSNAVDAVEKTLDLASNLPRGGK